MPTDRPHPVPPPPRLAAAGPGADGRTYDDGDPSAEQVIGVAADGSGPDMDAAVGAARRAFDDTAWSTDPAFRVRRLRQLRQALEDHADELRATTVAEVGAPVALTHGAQLDTPIEGIGWVADLAERYAWETDLGEAHDVDRPGMPRSGAPEANASLRLIGAAPLPVEVDSILKERFGVDTFSGAYGTTEASLVSWQPPGVTNKPNGAGVINDELFDVRISDDDNELPRGRDGEIVLRPKPPALDVQGYWGRPRRPSRRAATGGTTRATSAGSTMFRWCIEELPHFALPRWIEFRAELPRSPVGRVLKRELRAEGPGGARDAEASGITYDER